MFDKRAPWFSDDHHHHQQKSPPPPPCMQQHNSPRRREKQTQRKMSITVEQKKKKKKRSWRTGLLIDQTTTTTTLFTILLLLFRRLTNCHTTPGAPGHPLPESGEHGQQPHRRKETSIEKEVEGVYLNRTTKSFTFYVSTRDGSSQCVSTFNYHYY